MRHKYSTEAIVLARTPYKEAGILALILTKEFGLIYVRVEGVRRSGAKLAHALQTLCKSEIILVKGKDGWRVTGALLNKNMLTMLDEEQRVRVANVSGLMQRLYGKDVPDERIYHEFLNFIEILETLSIEEAEAAESLMVLRMLNALGMDAGEVPPEGFTASSLAYARENKKQLIERINKGIVSSGL